MSLRPCHCISQPRLWPSWPTRSWRKSHLCLVECYNRQEKWHFNHLESTWCFFLQPFLKQSWVFEWDCWIDSVLTSDNSAWQRCIDVSLYIYCTLHSSSHFDHGLSLHCDHALGCWCASTQHLFAARRVSWLLSRWVAMVVPRVVQVSWL